MSIDIRLATSADFDAILDVLHAAKGHDLTPKERYEQGFIQGTFTTEILTRFNEGPGLVIADAGDRLAGVCLSTIAHPPHGAPAALARNGDERWQPGNWIMYGPVTIVPEFRGQGLLRPMLRRLSEALVDYDVAAGFVESTNKKSLAVHDALGFVRDGSYPHDDREFVVVTFAPRHAAF